MARLTGKDLVVLWADSSGTLLIPTTRSFEPNIEREMVEYTGNGDTLRKFQATRIIAEPRLRYVGFDGTENGVSRATLRTRLVIGSIGTLFWGEYGTATGKPKGALKVSVTRHDAPITYDSELEFTLEFKSTIGTLIADPGTAVW